MHRAYSTEVTTQCEMSLQNSPKARKEKKVGLQNSPKAGKEKNTRRRQTGMAESEVGQNTTIAAPRPAAGGMAFMANISFV